jgi:tetratricopeptide (TPR) repeat protein
MKLGEVLRDAGDLPGSVRQYQAAIALEPDRPLAHGGLLLAVARTEARRKSLDRAIPDRALARAMRSWDDADRLASLATALRQAGFTDTALLPLDRSLALSPWPDRRLRTEAARAIERGDRKTAVLLLRHVQSSDATVREALRQLGGD